MYKSYMANTTMNDTDSLKMFLFRIYKSGDPLESTELMFGYKAMRFLYMNMSFVLVEKAGDLCLMSSGSLKYRSYINNKFNLDNFRVLNFKTRFLEKLLVIPKVRIDNIYCRIVLDALTLTDLLEITMDKGGIIGYVDNIYLFNIL